MNKPLEQTDMDDTSESNRSNDRNSLLLKAVLRFPSSGTENEVRIRNLSSGGLMANKVDETMPHYLPKLNQQATQKPPLRRI